jgi:hypothetical protein
MQALANIVPVKRNIQLAIQDLPGGYLALELFHQAVGKVDTPGLYPDQYGILQINMILQHLMTQTLDRNSQLLFIQDRLQRNVFMR